MTALRKCLWWVPLLAALWPGCAGGADDATIASPNRAAFDTQVWPILVRDCGFSACHGSEQRFFRVVGPGHERLDSAVQFSAPVTQVELQLSYDRARSMINAQDPGRSLLLLKPLAQAAGGVGHEGTDGFGRNVYQRVDDPNYQVLVQWAVSQEP